MERCTPVPAGRFFTDPGVTADAYRRFCWPVDGVAGLRLAPFQVLAGEGAIYVGHDRDWHLAIAGRLAAADPTELLVPTRSCVLDVTDPDAEEAAVTWWIALTAGGGEGMVVKPFAGLARRGGSRARAGRLGGGEPTYLDVERQGSLDADNGEADR